MKIKNTSGLVLAEALVAVATLGIAALALSSIIQNAISITTTSQDYLIAQNLVTEAIEAVKNVEESNLLIRPRELFPDQEECWLVLDPRIILDPDKVCVDTASVNGKYLAIQENGKWRMETVGGPDLDLNNIEPNTKVYRLLIKNKQYLHGAAGGAPTPFYRQIKFVDVPADHSKAEFEVKVEWQQGQKVRNIVRSYTLYNYL